MNLPYIGNHSFSIRKDIDESEINRLINDFKGFNDKTNEMNIIQNEKYPNTCKMFYRNWNGISWNINYTTQEVEIPLSSGLGERWNSTTQKYEYRTPLYKKIYKKNYKIEARINPRVFFGIQSNVIENTADIFETVKDKFNQEAKRISGILGEFSKYKMYRGKYYIDFDLTELRTPCTAEQMLILLNYGNVPFELNCDYNYFKDYNDDLFEEYTGPVDDLYLQCVVLTVQCEHFLQRSFYNNQEKLRDMIRFEVKCGYKEWTYLMKKLLTENSDYICRDILYDCYNWFIMGGDYYKLSQATNRVISAVSNDKERDRLIEALELISKEKGISKAIYSLNGEKLVKFYKSLRKLKGLGINPVTIPEEWDIEFVQNLLDARINGPYDPYRPLDGFKNLL